jgi:hypothetical protein
MQWHLFFPTFFAIFTVFLLMSPVRRCPQCSQKLPRFRKPKTIHEALFGGWTCPNCGAIVDRSGRRISA